MSGRSPHVLDRSNPPHIESDSEDESQNASTIDPQDHRARVKEYQNAAQYPKEPIYRVNQEVWIFASDTEPPKGPFLIVSIEAQNMYRLKKKDNGEVLANMVAENKLRVRR